MKKHFLFVIALFFIAAHIIAQAPKGIKYQTVVRDAAGALIANQQVNITISILQGSATGLSVCSESSTPTTNEFGLVNLEIGSVNPSAFAAIDWANGPYFTKVDLDGNVMGTSQLLSVPYALYSEKTNFTYEAGEGIQINDNIISTDMNLNTSVTGDTLFLVPGNYVIIPGISAANTDNAVVTTNLITDVTSTSAIVGYEVLLYGGSAITARGVCWDMSISPTINGYHTNDGTGTGTYNSQITDLMPATTYFVRAYATNSVGTTYGALKNFTTEGGTLPVVVLDTIDNINPNAAGAHGYITYEGSNGVYERGFCWNTLTNPTVYHYHVNCGSGGGSFTAALTTLIPSETYFVRAYAKNTTGISYSISKSFTATNAYYEGFENGFPVGWNGLWSINTSNAYEGYYSLSAPYANDSVLFTKTFSSSGQITFYYLGTEYFPNNPVARFYIDGTEVETYYDKSWTLHSATFEAGNHTFKWKNMGGGMTFIDYVICTEF